MYVYFVGQHDRGLCVCGRREMCVCVCMCVCYIVYECYVVNINVHITMRLDNHKP